MSGPIDIAVYAPLKAPDHPVPSGDRTMARLLVKALSEAGFAPHMPSALRSFEGMGDPARQAALRMEALREADALIARLRGAPSRPRLWFSYHVYYKSPDWIGPKVAAALGIPYVVAEGSRAAKRAGGPWAIGHEGAEQALDRAAIVFAMTEADEEALLAHRPATQRVLPLPPFLDLGEWPDRERTAADPAGPVRLLAVAMMRAGDKLQSYRQLAQALRRVNRPWRLDIAGSGPARGEVEALFAPFGPSVTFHGEIEDKARLASLYAEADILTWPAVNEAYGMILLEAQAYGCPILAGDHGGVASVVRDGETGFLVARDDPAALAMAITVLSADTALRGRLSQAARRFVREERNLQVTAGRLRSILLPLAKGKEP